MYHSKSDPGRLPISHAESRNEESPPQLRCESCNENINDKKYEEPQLKHQSYERVSCTPPIPCPMPSRSHADYNTEIDQELIERYNHATWQMYWRYVLK